MSGVCSTRPDSQQSSSAVLTVKGGYSGYSGRVRMAVRMGPTARATAAAVRQGTGGKWL